MPDRRRISAAVRRRLAQEAKHACSYCRSPSVAGVPMAIDHIVPVSVGGSNQSTNLCLACYRCNEFKGARTSAIDPLSGQTGQFYHPKSQRWADHFAWSRDGLLIQAVSLTGRVTVEALHMNSDWLIQARKIWILAGIHPPLD